jgi:TRAP-type C4-dicarboxylate transport system substrate-binding protein
MGRSVLKIWVFAALMCAHHAGAEAASLRLQSLDAPGSIATTGLARLADDLRRDSGGEIDIEIVPAYSAVGPAQTLSAMASGRIDGHYSSPGYFAAVDPAFALLGDTLALYPDPQTRDRWFDEGGGLELARALYAEHGAHLVGTVAWPEEWLVAAKPASILADIAGMRIRAPDGPVGDLLAKAGADVVALSGRDTLEAFRRGDLDAADWAGLAVNLDTGPHADAHYAVRAGHSMPVTEISVSSQAWDALTPTLRRLFEDKVAAFSRQQRTAFDAGETAARTRAAANGVTLLELSPRSREQLRDLSLGVFEDWGSRSPAAASIAASHRAFMERIGLVPPQKPDTPVGDGSG